MWSYVTWAVNSVTYYLWADETNDVQPIHEKSEDSGVALDFLEVYNTQNTSIPQTMLIPSNLSTTDPKTSRMCINCKKMYQEVRLQKILYDS